MVHDLSERGVPKGKIEAFAHDADTTREEAQALVQLAVQKKWSGVIVVTSNYHTRRVRYIFARVFPSTIRVRIASASDGDFDPEHWYQYRKSIKQLTREMAGLAACQVENQSPEKSSGVSQFLLEMMALILQ